MFWEMSRVHDKPQPREMCLHDVFEDDPRVYCVQGRELSNPKKVE